ncbi:hypothetical protein RHMOL_Rhmol01G0208800 [Rhododendron molle]|uniref:Uncharacterized protein n=1 Tax=Rhododendron molle TaxID=49168 RepID=A0ACC0Q741_RHOML|nr:hypothetical protein RHMOL_Rhmol01G0208800 [Rhododendron molle]
MAKEEEKKVITAVYKVNLHCPKCAEDIKKPLLRIAGVQSVDVQFEKGEVTVKGSIDEKEMHKRLEKLSKKKVEIVDNKAKITKEVRLRFKSLNQQLLRSPHLLGKRLWEGW